MKKVIFTIIIFTSLLSTNLIAQTTPEPGITIITHGLSKYGDDGQIKEWMVPMGAEGRRFSAVIARRSKT